MKLNNKGFVVEGALVIALLLSGFLLFVPNPVSNATGIGVRPNKTVLKESQTEKIVPLVDKEGNQLGWKQVTTNSLSDVDQQQQVTFWQSLVAVPRLILILAILGMCGFPAAVTFWRNVFRALKATKSDAKRIVASVEAGLNTLPKKITVFGADGKPIEVDTAYLKLNFMDAMSKIQDQSTRDLVKNLKRIE